MARCPGRPSSAAFVERVGDVTHRPRGAHPLAVSGDDAGALLAAMLQRVEPEIREVGGLGIAEDAEDAAFVFEFVEHLLCSIARGASAGYEVY